MFRDMRRIKQLMSDSDTKAVLERGTSGVLAVSGDDDYPYAVPVSYVFAGGKLYFHGAPAGHKIDSIKRNCKVSFCVIDKDTIVPEKFTTFFRSVIAFGKIHIIEDSAEKRQALERIADRYSPHASPDAREKELKSALPRVCMLEMIIDHMTGKEAIELVREKQNV